jgi:hypothetical protein
MALDDEILTEVEVARTRLEALEDDVYEARARFHQNVRRLHAAGGSMREIATALGMSHQRVHQIIGEEGIVEVEAASTDVTPHPATVVTADEDRCSFCGAPRREVDKLLAAPGRVFICSGCVERASRNLAPRDRLAECSFCRNQVNVRYGEPPTTICRLCVTTCERLLGTKDTKRVAMRRNPTMRCSFCNASQAQVAKLIAGPGVHICGACVAAVAGVASTGTATPAPRVLRVADREAHPCSFCGKRTPTVDAIVKGPRARICTECIALCDDILTEEGYRG